MFEWIGRRGAWMLVFLAAMVAGCASTASGPPEEVVRQRAQARWNALLDGDFSRAYDYMAPSYRALIERKRFPNQFGSGAGWQGAEVVSVTCETDRCKVVMKVAVRTALRGRSAPPLSTHFDENWVKEDGQWWMYQPI